MRSWLFGLDIVGRGNVVELPIFQVLLKMVPDSVHWWHETLLVHCTSFAMLYHYDLIVEWRMHPKQIQDDSMHLHVSFVCIVLSMFLFPFYEKIISSRYVTNSLRT